MATVTRENLGLLNDKLTVKVFKEDYYPSFEKALKDYSKKANIPGFRKGMVPAGMIKKMYGASIYYDEVLRSVEKQLQEYLTNEKPELLGQPLPVVSDLRHLDMNAPVEYDFPFEIGLKPEIDVAGLPNTQFIFHKVLATDKMIDDEIERLQSRHGKMSDPESVSSEDNVLNVTFVEIDSEGNTIEGGIVKDNSLLVKYFTPAYREQLLGKKNDDFLQMTLKDAFDEKEREWIISDLGLDKNDSSILDKTFKLTITKVGLVEKREMNEEFFNEVFQGKDIKTEDDFKKEISDNIQKELDAQSSVQLHDQIYHHLIDSSIDFPEEFLKKWLQKGGEKEKSAEEVEGEFPVFKDQLKWTLITDKLIRENGIEVTEAEVKDNMVKEVMQYFGQSGMGGGDMSWLDSYIDRMMQDKKQVDRSYRKLITDKMFSWIEGHVAKTEKVVTAEELAAMQHNHQH
ncbi:MAG: trigger factor [Ginsengibacter sp.]